MIYWPIRCNSRRLLGWTTLLIALCGGATAASVASPGLAGARSNSEGIAESIDPFRPYNAMGDGTLRLGGQSIRYRQGEVYQPVGLRQIHRLFGTNYDTTTARLELRLIELLDHIQDHFGGAAIVLRSGYRSPVANSGLRRRGKLAAQSSMHIEGGAADFHLAGVASATVAEYARSLGIGGVGYYHGQEVHLDTGPARFWDERTSGTESREPQHNAKIILLTDADRYRRGTPVQLRLMRITDFPVSVPTQVALECGRQAPALPGRAAIPKELRSQQRGHWRSIESIAWWAGSPTSGTCVTLADRAAARRPQWTAVPSAECQRYRVRVDFCSPPWPEMPATITSNEFEIHD